MGANLQNRGANGRFASVSDVFKKEVVHSCPSCYLREVKVIESRRSSNHIRRRRECLSCNHRWSTMEISKELYDRLVASELLVSRVQKVMAKKEEVKEPISEKKICENCVYWESECTMDFPEAGGEFARDCSLYTELV